jgi:hypothetical protein
MFLAGWHEIRVVKRTSPFFFLTGYLSPSFSRFPSDNGMMRAVRLHRPVWGLERGDEPDCSVPHSNLGDGSSTGCMGYSLPSQEASPPHHGGWVAGLVG